MSYLYELSVRKDRVGGPVVAARETPAETWHRQSPVILFIHGYNNDYDGALGSYGACVMRLAPGQPASEPTLWSLICAFYWPGDARPSWLSPLAYPFQIEDAVNSAEQLAAFLRSQYAGERARPALVILAHSLGCRLALELVDRLRKEDWFGKVLTRVCLMAAAVDVDTVASGGALEVAANFCAEKRRQLTIVSSSGDNVLRYFFPLGSTLAEPGSGRALGLFGPPPGLMEVVRSRAFDALDHGDYWPMKNDALRGTVAAAIGISQTDSEPEVHICPQHDSEPARAIAVRQLAPAWELSAP